jgi:5-methylcytosine-specific restriction endonuclease McrA
LKNRCSRCSDEVAQQKAAVADAKARGYGGRGNTPEYKRRQHEAMAAREGRTLAPYIGTPEGQQYVAERKRHAATVRVEQKARGIRLRAFQAMYRDLLALWGRAYPEESLPSEEDLRIKADAFKRRYWADPERARHQKRIYKTANPEKDAAYRGKRGLRMVTTADGTLTPGNLNRMFDSAKVCAYCGGEMTGVSQKSLDHFIPLCLGGRHSAANIFICCLSCNFEKSKTHPFIWLGAEMFERLLAILRKRCAGEPSEVSAIYPQTQVEAT